MSIHTDLATPYQWKEQTQLAKYKNLPTPPLIRKRWCFGLPLNMEDGTQMQDEDIELYIASAVRECERRLSVPLRTVKIVCNPTPDMVEGTDYDIVEPPYDYNVNMYHQNWGHLQLRRRPVQKVDRISLMFPNGQKIFDFPPEWIKVYNRSGQVKIVPYSGFSTVLSSYPLYAGFLGVNTPQMIWIDYTAGYDEIPEDIHAIIAKIASCDILGIAGDAVLAGVASLSTSVDGLSESFSTTASATNATYGAHILQYQKEIDNFFDPTKGHAREKYFGISIV